MSLRLGHPRATAVSAVAGRLAHAVDDIPMRGVSTCASVRAALSLYPCTPASEGRIQNNGGGGVAVRTTDLDIVTNQQLQLYFFIWKIKRKKADPTTLGRWVKKRVKVIADMGD